jgi:hypothetical protein
VRFLSSVPAIMSSDIAPEFATNCAWRSCHLFGNFRLRLMKASHCSDLMSLICGQMLISIHHTTPLQKKSLMLSGLQGVVTMDCLLHLLCESAPPNKPSCGRASTRSVLRHPKLAACRSGAAFEGFPWPYIAASAQRSLILV